MYNQNIWICMHGIQEIKTLASGNNPKKSRKNTLNQTMQLYLIFKIDFREPQLLNCKLVSIVIIYITFYTKYY